MIASQEIPGLLVKVNYSNPETTFYAIRINKRKREAM
jgi:hypothetical protein